MKDYLDEKLIQYAKSDFYPFHMPGHKRQMDWNMNPYSIDITEIDGFDNLHEAEGIIAEAQQRAATLYGAKNSYYLVNGSTSGILSAISATVKPGGKLLIARNCHKAVYHGAYLRGIKLRYLYPVIATEGIWAQITPESVEAAFAAEPDLQAVILTSPTYDGIVSDIKAIADIVHRHHIPLIVDEAHGAHLGFHPYFPPSAVKLGADLVIQSLHKTLPSFTQSALLHYQSGLVDRAKIERYLKIYQTSSPSYLMMAGMDRCIRLLTEQGEELFEQYAKNLQNFYQRTASLSRIELLNANPTKGGMSDPSKILLRATAAGLNGKQLYDRFLNTYHLQMEMCSSDYVLAMTSMMDSPEGFERLYQALAEINQAGENGHQLKEEGNQTEKNCGLAVESSSGFMAELYRPGESVLELYEAWEQTTLACPLDDAVGKIAAEFVNLYPPGIPVLVPGERITPELQGALKKCLALHLHVQGITDKMRIKVVN